MKFLILLLAAGSLFTFTACENDAKITEEKSDSAIMADSANYTSIQWIDSTNQQLSKVTEGQVVDISWRFKNTGDKPLIISSVSAGCGCTASDPPKEPVAPGEEGVIRAKFDSKNQVGHPTKSVTVQANTKESGVHNLTFSIEVTKE